MDIIIFMTRRFYIILRCIYLDKKKIKIRGDNIANIMLNEKKN